jgi:hypothetical protein
LLERLLIAALRSTPRPVPLMAGHWPVTAAAMASSQTVLHRLTVEWTAGLRWVLRGHAKTTAGMSGR